MSSAALKTLAVIMVIGAVVLGFVAYQLSQNLTQPAAVAETPQPQLDEDQVLAVVAIEKIPAYQPIRQEQVALVPVSVEPEEYFISVDEVTGRPPLREVAIGTTLTPKDFRPTDTLVQAIPDGHQALSLEISDVVAVGGFVKPGDIVDLLVYLRGSRDEAETQARILLPRARLLAYQERLINDPDQEREGQEEPGARRRVRTAVVSVPEKDVTRVMLGASLGEVRLALNGEAAQARDTETEGEAKPETLAVDNNKDKDKKEYDPAEPEFDQKPITLEELARLKKKQKRQQQQSPAYSVVIQRGNDTERVTVRP